MPKKQIVLTPLNSICEYILSDDCHIINHELFKSITIHISRCKVTTFLRHMQGLMTFLLKPKDFV